MRSSPACLAGKPFITILTSGISASTDPRQKRWFGAASELTSNIFGTIWLLTMPLLPIGGDKSLGEALGEQAKLVATQVTVVVLLNTGHWVMEESPKETTDALIRFL